MTSVPGQKEYNMTLCKVSSIEIAITLLNVKPTQARIQLLAKGTLWNTNFATFPENKLPQPARII